MGRKQFLKLLILALSGTSIPMYAKEKNIYRSPAFFVGHGSPINAISDNEFTQSLSNLGKTLKKPKAILMISAHWTPPYNAISVHSSSDLMYDFFGFSSKLEEVKYPAPNAKELSIPIKRILKEVKIKDRPLDHGAWSVLIHLFPDANIPVMQLGINRNLSLQEHFDRAKKLAQLREMGVMIIGSGNITHNLREYSADVNAPIVPWAKSFDTFVKEAIVKRDFNALIDFQNRNPYANKAHPTLEHYIPLLYIAGLSRKDEKSQFIYEKIEHGSFSMRSWLIE